MYQYSVIQWLFFFYFYCFMGWCIESAHVSIRTRKLTNRGFMRGPFLPLYGSGAIMMLVVSMPFQDSIILTYLAGCVGATILEYITGVTMEALFKVRYWDYSNQKFNFQGHICLGTTLSWGLLTILMTEIVHVPVEKLMLSIPYRILTIVTIFLTVIIAVDFALSFKAAIDLRNILVRMEQAKQELVHIQKRLDVIFALANEEWESRKEEWENRKEERVVRREERNEGILAKTEAFTEGLSIRIEDLRSSIEGKLAGIKSMVQSKPSQYLEDAGEELSDLKTEYAVNVEKRKQLGRIRDFFQRDMLRSNPGMTSVKFREALEELKRNVSSKK
ncbi:MAG: putative ABC transporter permease [Lachnospiraceae bacterium]|nr:putative ABC transporter permease [Muribaculaceae bacterium]MCM1409064.1 putative ABC transporter permease [Lachnospiraceae bacterium]